MGRSSASPTASRARVPHQPTIQKHRDTRTESSPAGVTGRHEATGQDREQTTDDEARRLIRALQGIRANPTSIQKNDDEYESIREPVVSSEPHPVGTKSDSASRRFPTPEAEELERQLVELGIECQYIYVGGGDSPGDGPFRFLSLNMRDVENKLGHTPEGFIPWQYAGRDEARDA